MVIIEEKLLCIATLPSECEHPPVVRVPFKNPTTAEMSMLTFIFVFLVLRFLSAREMF